VRQGRRICATRIAASRKTTRNAVVPANVSASSDTWTWHAVSRVRPQTCDGCAGDDGDGGGVGAGDSGGVGVTGDGEGDSVASGVGVSIEGDLTF
jgi:hypothetical protein